MLSLIFVNINIDLDDNKLTFYNITIHEIINEISKGLDVFFVVVYKFMSCPDFIWKL